MILLTGFGPFRDVTDNPSARLVRALHGTTIAGHSVVAEVLPVSWTRGTRLVLDLIDRLRPELVLGFGVAVGRANAAVERLGTPQREGLDVDGDAPTPVAGPAHSHPRLDVARLAEALGVGVSDDAGRYLCNAWLYEVSLGRDVPAAFIHIPDAGLDPAQVADGLARWFAVRA